VLIEDRASPREMIAFEDDLEALHRVENASSSHG
jgi:hypothetical protein